MIVVAGLALTLAAPALASARPKPEKSDWGWICEITDPGEVKIYKVKGAGAKRRRDVVCE
jgi:hypothetical protein